jgi:DNA sulfur modification protein DndD
MWIELTLDGVELPGAIHQIQVRRTWHFHSLRGTYDHDELTIHKDGKPLEIIDSDHWQDFINETIPSGVAGFFFFDGEKIQQLADDTSDREALRESIRNLLGLTVYGKLKDDLSKHTDDIRRAADKVTDDQLKQLEADQARLRRLITENREQHGQLQAELQRLQGEDEELEREVRRLAGVGADSRDDLQREIAELESVKRAANEEVLKVGGELLPFAIAGRICDELKAQLEAEEKLRQWEASKARVHPQLERIVSRVFFDPNTPRPRPDISPTQRTFYADRLTQEWEALFIPKPDDAADTVLHDISPKEGRFILNMLDTVSTQTLTTFKELLKQRERASRRLLEANRTLRNLPEDDSHLGGLFDQRRINEERKQKLNRDIGVLDDEYARRERELKTIDERINNLKSELEKADFDRSKVALTRKIQSVLERYEKELQNRKLEELENLTTEMYRRLARKGDFVGQVKIDPRTFDVIVKDPRGRVKEKRSLSAGEKQIYAISLLWGLAFASNVELPIIIDTPFARLDSEHRTNIAKHYFPHASEQVIILSTDEEVDHHYIELLRTNIGRTYLIEHLDVERRSLVREGYFSVERLIRL